MSFYLFDQKFIKEFKKETEANDIQYLMHHDDFMHTLKSMILKNYNMLSIDALTNGFHIEEDSFTIENALLRDDPIGPACNYDKVVYFKVYFRFNLISDTITEYCFDATYLLDGLEVAEQEQFLFLDADKAVDNTDYLYILNDSEPHFLFKQGKGNSTFDDLFYDIFGNEEIESFMKNIYKNFKKAYLIHEKLVYSNLFREELEAVVEPNEMNGLNYKTLSGDKVISVLDTTQHKYDYYRLWEAINEMNLQFPQQKGNN